MSNKKQLNQLGLLIHKIMVDKGNMDLKSKIIDELVETCQVTRASVRRWLRNDSQPVVSMISLIISVLNVYDDTLADSDFFAPKTVSNAVTKPVSKKHRLVK